MSQPDPTPQQPQSRRRHLMDPANPQRPTAASNVAMGRVQRWVMSALAVTTVMHFAGGLVLAAVFLDGGQPGAQVGLVLISAVVGVLGVAAGFVIHQKNPLTPWLLVGLLPAAVGLWLVLA